ncbi:MAG: Dihydroanticapsin 7-dehydrogenase [Chloroflexi bacterium]|nr:Dihydroanticapsin 7-dehydrogenase [Chloroflexota bacterium]
MSKYSLLVTHHSLLITHHSKTIKVSNIRLLWSFKIMPIQEKFDLKDRVAVITGGGGLLGEEFARTLGEAGASVVVADLDGGLARRVASALSAAGVPSLAVQTDVTNPASVQNMVAQTLNVFGRLDILVNSAALDPKVRNQENRRTGEQGNRGTGEQENRGTGEQENRRTGEQETDSLIPDSLIPDPPIPDSLIPDPLSHTFENYPLELWNQALNVNLTGMFLASQAAVGPMLEQEYGVIINLCSIYGLAGPDQRIYQREGQPPQFKPVHYAVTKAGVLGLTRYLATYYAGKNIRTNALTPGGVYNEHDDEFVKSYSARAVMGRMARKDEMNGALLFLASDASSYMTGANLVVDGGWTAW